MRAAPVAGVGRYTWAGGGARHGRTALCEPPLCVTWQMEVPMAPQTAAAIQSLFRHGRAHEASVCILSRRGEHMVCIWYALGAAVIAALATGSVRV